MLERSALQMGYLENAKQFYLRSLAYFESIQDEFEIAQAKHNLSEVYVFTREFDVARQTCKHSLQYYVKVGQSPFIISSLQVKSKIVELQGEYESAVELLALIENHPETLPVDTHQAHIALEQLRAQMSEYDFVTTYNRSKVLNSAEVVTSILYDN